MTDDIWQTRPEDIETNAVGGIEDFTVEFVNRVNELLHRVPVPDDLRRRIRSARFELARLFTMEGYEGDGEDNDFARAAGLSDLTRPIRQAMWRQLERGCYHDADGTLHDPHDDVRQHGNGVH